MASKSALLPRSSQHRLLLGRARRPTPSACPACAKAASSPRHRPRATTTRARRRDATTSSRRHLSSTPPASHSPRAELERTLVELQEHAPNLVNLPRIQLALQGLRQEAGSEIVRIAILGLANGSSRAGPTARRVLRALLADPLQEEQPWERELEGRTETTPRPLIVRVGPRRQQQHAVSLTLEREGGLGEMHVSSPPLDGLNLEFLLMEVHVANIPGGTSAKALEDAVLVPAVEMPSAADRTLPMSAPVHQTLLVGDGFPGAVSMSALPLAETSESTAAAVQLKGFPAVEVGEKTAFSMMDVSLAEKGVRLFRQGPQHAMDYERLWSRSNVPLLLDWLKSGTSSSADETKPAVRRLIASTLRNTLAEVQLREDRVSSRASSLERNEPHVAALNTHLVEWAQRAHTELQQELDRAFAGRRWRKLGWWKLFWRVDDVAMLTNEMLAQRFMPTAEQELVYLAGRVSAHLGGSSARDYPQPWAPSDAGRKPLGCGEAATPKWPTHIAFTRRYLQEETVPALQSLAQRLVLESLGTSGLATSLAALLYVSSSASTVYEAGAAAALGIVYSLGRVQKRWDAARSFWEGEVREEGRKAVRGAEESVAAVLRGRGADGSLPEGMGGLARTRELVGRAEGALGRMK